MAGVARDGQCQERDDAGQRRQEGEGGGRRYDEDELFELDIARLDGHRGRYCSAAAADDDHAAEQNALLGNCLLPVRSVSSAVPVDAISELSSTTYPYSGYHSSRRLVLFTGGSIGSRRFLLGRAAGHGNSARFCFSSRGFETYFQRY